MNNAPTLAPSSRAPLVALALALACGTCAAILGTHGSGALLPPAPTQLSTGTAALDSGLVVDLSAGRVLPRSSSARLEDVSLRVGAGQGAPLFLASAQRGRWFEATLSLRGDVRGRLTPAGAAWLQEALGRDVSVQSGILEARRVLVRTDKLELEDFTLRLRAQGEATLSGAALVLERRGGAWCASLQGPRLRVQIASLEGARALRESVSGR